jgi:hypothetical protein
MKKLLTIGSFIFFCSTAFSQHSYFTINTGYGLPSSQRTLFTEVTNKQGSTNVQAVRGSYGSGFRTGIGFQRMTKNDWGWGVELEYLFSKISRTNSTEDFGGAYMTEKLTSKANSLFVVPSVSKQFDTFGHVVPHLSFGLVLGKPKVITETKYEGRTLQGQRSDGDSRTELAHKFAFGSRFGAGVDFVAEKGIAFLDIEFNILSPWKDESVLVSRHVDAVDLVAGTTKESRTTKYEKDFNPATSPNTTLADTTPLGSLALRFGVRLFLRR